MPWLSTMVAFVAPERLTKNVSFPSNTVSPFTTTLTTLVVSPMSVLNVNVPDWAT